MFLQRPFVFGSENFSGFAVPLGCALMQPSHPSCNLCKIKPALPRRADCPSLPKQSQDGCTDEKTKSGYSLRNNRSDCRQSWCWDYSQHHFSVYSASSAKNPNKLKNSDILDALFPRILASFFRFMQAKVSPAFISIRAFPIYWV